MNSSIRAFLFLVALLPIGVTHSESLFTGANATASPSGAFSGPVPTSSAPSNSWSAHTSGTRPVSGAWDAGSSAEAVAGFGILKVSAKATAGNFSGAWAGASAGWKDTLKIISPDYAGGTSATVKWSFFLTGQTGAYASDLVGGGAGAAWYSEYAFGSDSGYYNSFHNFFGPGNESLQQTHNGVPGEAYGMHTFETIVSLGSSLTQSLSLNCSAHAAAPEGVSASTLCELDKSLYWGGIESVSIGSNAINYSLTSASGTDWSKSFITPVPEPETYAMLLAGLGLLGFAARRRN